MTRALCLAASVTILIAVLSPPASAQGRCTTKWNQLLQQYETRCDDGSSATEKYNPLAQQWEKTIQRQPNPEGVFQPQQRCVRKWNAVLPKKSSVAIVLRFAD